MERIYIYGTGSKVLKFLPALALKYYIVGFLDSDIKRQGEVLLGKKIYHISSVSIGSYDHIVIVSTYIDEINKVIACSRLEEGIAVEQLSDIVLLSQEYARLESHYQFNSKLYWENRYASGGNSGGGSYNSLAEYKSKIINDFVKKNGVNTVVEYGCGDGNQLSYASYEKYTGVDVSETAINLCKKKFSADDKKEFFVAHQAPLNKYDLALSLDVIYHLIEDETYEKYIDELFISSSRYVIVYSSNSDDNSGVIAVHVKHRNFTKYIAEHIPEWVLLERIENDYPYQGDDLTGSFSDFYIFGRR